MSTHPPIHVELTDEDLASAASWATTRAGSGMIGLALAAPVAAFMVFLGFRLMRTEMPSPDDFNPGPVLIGIGIALAAILVVQAVRGSRKLADVGAPFRRTAGQVYDIEFTGRGLLVRAPGGEPKELHWGSIHHAFRGPDAHAITQTRGAVLLIPHRCVPSADALDAAFEPLRAYHAANADDDDDWLHDD